MWAANLQQVYGVSAGGDKFAAWVIFLRLGADTRKEQAIRDLHESVDEVLATQNVRYTEITTHRGKNEAYSKFGVRDRDHPLFLILNKPPIDYGKDDPFLVIEWGKWNEIDDLKNDLMRLVNFFSDENFVKSISRAKDVTAWDKLKGFTTSQGVSALGVGATILSAIL